MSRFKKRSVSILLALSILVTFVCSFAGSTAAAPADNTARISSGTNGLAQNIQDGVILHAWNWSYNTIKNNMADIAAAGYSAVQTSPVQPPRDFNASWTQVSTQWWKLYQPLDITFAEQYTWMGTKAEFKSMCDTAHSYGVKIVVDIVANHLANVSDGKGNASDNRNSGIPDYLRNNDSYWHVNSIWANDGNRYDMTMGSTGQPDLNTGNTAVQNLVINLMKTCVDNGADGFRFDAAKHIEVPEDPYGAGSNFWPNVTGTVNSYASATKGKSMFYYGEILNTATTALSNYTEYIGLTDNQTGNNVRTNVLNGNAAGAASSSYVFNAGANKTVLWAESHDIFADNQFTSNTDIMLTWAIVASRADATSLFLARPWSYTGNEMGQAGDTSWKGKNVAQVNKFHNYFVGQGEYLSSSGSVVINERGTTGAVLVNLSGNTVSVNAPANRMISGTYTDHISGNTFTVSNGRITGSISGKNIAVLYNTAPSPSGTKTIYLQDKLNWTNVYAYCWNSVTGAKKAAWPGTMMSYVRTTPDTHEKIYKVTFNDSDYDYIIFTNGSGTQTVDLPTATSGTVYYCTSPDFSGKYKVSCYPFT